MFGADIDPTAQGRIRGSFPVGVLDIGSNSVRLVVYERHTRALTPLYNEKAACALGRGVAASGRLADESVEKSITAIRRFALVSRLMRVGAVHVLATSAVRDAENGPDFVKRVEEIMGAPVKILSGPEEAHFAALGVVAGMPGFAGVVGDLGGGSLELSNVAHQHDIGGETHALGAIRLQDDSGGDLKKLGEIVKARLADSQILGKGEAQQFCAIGGTWRSLVKVHQVRRKYPLHMIQDYVAEAGDILELCEAIITAAANGKKLPGIENASSGRRPLLPYGAAVLAEVIRTGGFKEIVFSALGVREGYLFGKLSAEEQSVDPLLQAAEEMSILRARSPRHAEDLIGFSERFVRATGLEESRDDERLRLAACLLSDIGWRGHPDYRGEQSVDLVAYGSLTGISHPERAFLAEALAVRYMGLKHKSESRALAKLAGSDATERARLIGALFRVAYPLSAGMAGVLPQVGFAVADGALVLQLPRDLAFLDGDHLRGRMKQLANAGGWKGSAVTCL